MTTAGLSDLESPDVSQKFKQYFCSVIISMRMVIGFHFFAMTYNANCIEILEHSGCKCFKNTPNVTRVHQM